jgi:hypothetical protein
MPALAVAGIAAKARMAPAARPDLRMVPFLRRGMDGTSRVFGRGVGSRRSGLDLTLVTLHPISEW